MASLTLGKIGTKLFSRWKWLKEFQVSEKGGQRTEDTTWLWAGTGITVPYGAAGAWYHLPTPPHHYSTHYRVPLSWRAWYVLLQMILILRVHCLYLINSLWLLVEILEGTTLDPFEQIFIQRLLPPWQFTRVFLGERIKGDLVWEAALVKGRKTTELHVL